MVTQETRQSPKNQSKQAQSRVANTQNGVENNDTSSSNNNNDSSMFSPRFKSVAEMAGWDEEALLLASLLVEDTPDRNLRNKKRSDLHVKSPPTSSRRKRRARRRSPGSLGVTVFNLDEEESSTNNDKGNAKKAESENAKGDVPDKVESNKGKHEQDSASCSNTSTLPCMDRLREELSCAICLEICFEPSTTPCGHSFCKKCLRSAADKCGKRCPKCRQFISNGRSCTVNTVLWNTIQLLFPVEVEARKAAGVQNSREAERQSLGSNGQPSSNPHLTRRIRPMASRRDDGSVRSRREDISLTRGEDGTRSRRGVPSQDEDAALALRLQREEFMDIYRGSTLARDNLRAMAQRAINLRVRHRAV